jgi:hypothetical protein
MSFLQSEFPNLCSTSTENHGYLQMSITTIVENDIAVTTTSVSGQSQSTLGYKHFRFDVSDEKFVGQLADKLQSLTGQKLERR